MTTIDLSPIINAVAVVVGLTLTACAPLIAALIVRKLSLDKNAAAVTAIDSACNTGAGLAYAALVDESHRPASVQIKSAALAQGVQHVLVAVPAALALAGVTEGTVARMIAGRLGQLLARDTGVTAGPSASMPPPSAIGPAGQGMAI